MYIGIFISVFVYQYMFISICTSVYVYPYLYISICLSVYVHRYMYISIHIHNSVIFTFLFLALARRRCLTVDDQLLYSHDLNV